MESLASTRAPCARSGLETRNFSRRDRGTREKRKNSRHFCRRDVSERRTPHHDGKNGSMTAVIQRTDDGDTREATRAMSNGATHTRIVDVLCNPDAGKCVKEVEVDRQN
jgi:hypothetical protein